MTTPIPESACFHCGEPVPAGASFSIQVDGQQREVCCAGCQAVTQLIYGAGLGRYYQFRQDLARKASEDLEQERLAWQSCDDRQSLWGPPTNDGFHELLLQTEGIRCAACAWLIRSHLEKSQGVKSTQVDTATGYTRILWNPERARLSDIASSLMELGYKPHLPIAGEEEQGRQAEKRASMKRLGVAGLGMMQVMMYAVGLYAGDAFGISDAARSFLEWVSLLVTLPVLLYSGRIFFQGAWRSLVARRPGMDVPVALAIGLAFIASCYNFFTSSGEVWFDSVVMFIFFLSLGRHIEMVLRHSNLQAGAALARLMPEWAMRIEPEGRSRIPAADLCEGDQVWVRPGEGFPADGVLIDGPTRVDESLLTGESCPVNRSTGEEVIAGTLNIDQPVAFKVTASGSETTLSALGRLLLSAQTRRDQQDDLPGWLVPVFIAAVLFIALFTWIAWRYVDPGQAFSACLAVLVASCPCALSLALPAVYAASSRRLLDEGILLTRGTALRALNSIDTVIFDKTGTLTRGYPEIESIAMNPDRAEFTEMDARRLAYLLESGSAHPIARAFSDMGSFDGVVTGLQNHPGSGVGGCIDGKQWRLGQAENDLPDIWLADEQSWVARFRLRDALREGAEATVSSLMADQVDVQILSGDHKEPVAAVAKRLGISNYKARQDAVMKLAELERQKAEGHRVLMVGDGVNDAPVLAAASVSMTVKGGAELANSTADMILTGESLSLLNKAREIGRRAAVLVRQNLTWAIAYNVSVLPLAVSGMLKPWMAALGMSLSSLIVVMNAARLSRNNTS